MKKKINGLIVLLLTASMLVTAPTVPAVAAEEKGNAADQETQVQVNTEEVSEPEEGMNDTPDEKAEGLIPQETDDAEKESEVEAQSESESDTGSDVGETSGDTVIAAEIPEGDGTVDYPYQIATKEDLVWFAGLVNGTLEDGTEQRVDACAKLTADIVFNNDIHNSEAEQWIPIGNTQDNAYTGYFLGDDHTITGLVVSQKTDAGVFGYLNSAHVSDLTVSNSAMEGSRAGGIASVLIGKTKISECRVQSSRISADEQAGGIVSIVSETSTVSSCESIDTQIYGAYQAGGIAGCVQTYDAQISECYNTGEVGGSECIYAGGIAGYNNGSISVSTNAGDISCVQNDGLTYAGGIVGYNTAIIGMCCNKANITAYGASSYQGEYECGASLGGIAGFQGMLDGGNPIMMYCYNLGTIGNACDVTAAGGLIGYNQYGVIIGSYNYGKNMVTDGPECMSGAIAGYMGVVDRDRAYNCYYLIGTSEKAFGTEEEIERPVPMNTLSNDLIQYSAAWSSYPEEKSQEEFASGEVAWLMNQDPIAGYSAWFQRLSGEEKNTYPVLEYDENGTVYANTTQQCPDAPETPIGFNNDRAVNEVLGDHNYHDTVPCSYCGNFMEYSELPKNDEGYYEIDSADDLYWFAAKVNDMHNLYNGNRMNAVLTADITVNENVLSYDGTLNENTDNLRIWEPIGYISESSSSRKYRGIFDGNGHTISGLYQPSDVYTENEDRFVTGGLFGVLYANATVKNVKVADSYFVGPDGWSACGGIAGCVTPLEVNMLQEKSGDTTLNDLSEMRSQAHIADCEFDGVVKAYHSGGIVGAVQLTDPYMIFGCMNYGSVFSIGKDYSASPDDYEPYPVAAGGICGWLNSTSRTTIAVCGNEGDIHGTNRVGGIIGSSFSEGKIEIAGVYNLGAIEGQEYVGGLAGEIYDGRIYTAYNAGAIKSDSTDTTGGIVGVLDYKLEDNCLYYDKEVYTGRAVGTYLGSTQDDSPELGVSTKEFSDGDIGKALNASMLNEQTIGIWYQTLGQDKYPTFDSSRDKMKVTVTVTSKIMGGDESTVATVAGGGIYEQGEEITLSAPEVPGFKFCGWFINEDNEIGNPYGIKLVDTFPVPMDMDLVAVYEPNENAAVIVKGTGFKVNGEESPAEEGYTGTFRLGEKITLEYTGTQEFLYWKSENGNILSKSKTYSFTLIGNTTVIPVCVDNSTDKSAFVEFVSDYGQVIMADTYNADAEISFPAGPSQMGGIFQGWSVDGAAVVTPEQVLEMIQNGERHITLRPVYQMSENKYTISVVTIVDWKQDSTVKYENIQEGTLYTVKAPEIEGKNFLYWSNNENGSADSILSYSEYYAVKVSKDITLYAIYNDEEWGPIEKYPTVTITESTRLEDGDRKKLRFVSTYDVPEGYEIQESGVIYSTDSRYGGENADDIFTIGADNVKQAATTEKQSFGTFTLTLSVGENLDVTAYVRGYLIVKNKDTGAYETIYSQISSGSYNSLH